MGKYQDIGARLKEERERLGRSQTYFADLAGVTRKTVFGYENGDRSPDGGALSAWAGDGADVVYILTGVHAGKVDSYFDDVEMRLNQESLPISAHNLEASPELKAMREKLETIWRERTATPENRARAELFLRLAFRHPDAMQSTMKRIDNAQDRMRKSDESLRAAEIAVGWIPPILVRQAIMTALFSHGLTPDGAITVLQMLQSQAKADGIWGYENSDGGTFP